MHSHSYLVIIKLIICLGASPSSRGRKGRNNKDEANLNYDVICEQWIKEVDVNALLHEEGFKKHLQNHCNKSVKFSYCPDHYPYFINYRVFAHVMNKQR